MKHVLVPIANGSEELELVTLVDTLRRAELEVVVASVEEELLITASRRVKIQADCAIEDCVDKQWDLVVLPGGMPGAERLGANGVLHKIIEQQLEAQAYLGAICAAPAVVLGRKGLIHDYQATCYPAFSEELEQACKDLSQARVCQDRNLITSQGPGTALEFALVLVELLAGADKAKEVAKGMLF